MYLVLGSPVFQAILVKAVQTGAILLDGAGPSGGIFGPIMDQITKLARDLWGVLVGLIIIAATLGMIVAVLRGAGGMMIGGSKETTAAIIGVVGVVLRVVVAFVAIPQLAEMMKNLRPDPPF
jgi:hypothetical protein